jgi:hypothetical protein
MDGPEVCQLIIIHWSEDAFMEFPVAPRALFFSEPYLFRNKEVMPLEEGLKYLR